jgi:hypothetical protein
MHTANIYCENTCTSYNQVLFSHKKNKHLQIQFYILGSIQASQ